MIGFVIVAAACSQQKQAAKKAEVPFRANEFVLQTVLTAQSNIDLGAMAAKRGRLDVTRDLGKRMNREQQELRASFATVAQKKNIVVPPGIEPKKAALRDNLSILPGQVFDRGYSLAMVQDLRSMSRQMQRAAQSGDPELAQLSKRYLPLLQQQEKNASEVLKRLGGSPFGFE